MEVFAESKLVINNNLKTQSVSLIKEKSNNNDTTFSYNGLQGAVAQYAAMRSH